MSEPITEITIRRKRLDRDSYSELRVRIDQQGELVLLGRNASVAITRITDKQEYAYSLTVPAEWRDSMLLYLMKDRFSDALAFSDWCREHGIPTMFESHT